MLVEAFNSAIVSVAQVQSLGADFTSSIIDFRESSHGSIQIRWSGVSVFTGTFVIYGSLFRDPSTFDDNDIEQSDYVISKAAGSHLWNYHKLTFRYAQLRWTAGANPGGLVDIVATGRRS